MFSYCGAKRFEAQFSTNGCSLVVVDLYYVFVDVTKLSVLLE